MSLTPTTSFVNTTVARLIEDLILGAITLDRGLAELLPRKRKQISLNRFFADGDNLTVRFPLFSDATDADAMTKDEKIIDLSELQFSDTFDPVEFNLDHEFLWTQGPSVESEPSAELNAAVMSVITKNINENLERLMWQGDTGGAGMFVLLDGFIKKIDADVTVNSATTAGPITSANIITALENLVAATPAEVQELSNPTILLSHTDKYFYREAARALNFKGTNISEAIVDIFGGYPMVSTQGIPAGRLFLLNAGGGEDSELKVGTWADADRMNVLMAKESPLDDVFGIRARLDIGVNHVYGKQITEYSTS